MSNSLLATKLHIPPVSLKRVARPRLLARLTEGLTYSLTLISAPAGFGKTTLLGEWHTSDEGKGFPLAWLSLDTDDNDPLRFFTYVIAALTKLEEEICETTLPLLQSLEPPPVKVIVTALINDWGKVSFPFALVLDDYHIISSPPIHEALGYLLDHLPSQMHLVILTRADPLLPLARLRARNQLVELRAGDLRFTNDEAAAFLNRTMGLNLSAEDISILEQRTEGWIAGLQMAALSMRGRQDLPSFIAAFTGDHRFILDYLTEEVLQRQPERIRKFLLQTSILDRMSGPLCDAVVERTAEDQLATNNLLNSQMILEELERANVFVVPLDDERRWYRYHHLFADLLRNHLRQTQSHLVIELHRRASRWFEQNGLIEEAVRHALAAQDYDLARRLIHQIASELWGRGEVRTMLGWFKTIPPPVLRSQPKSCIAYAASLTVAGQFDSAQVWLRHAEKFLYPNSDGAIDPATAVYLSTTLDIYRSVIARFSGDLTKAIALSQRALEQTDQDNARAYGIVLLFHGHAQFYAGNDDVANRILVQAIETTRASGHIAACLNASHHLAQLRVLQGRLREARAIYHQAIELVAQQKHPVFVGVERSGMGQLYCEWNDLATAIGYVQDGLQLAETGGDIFFLRDAYIARARLAQAQGNLDEALAFAQKGEQIARTCPGSTDIAYLQAWQARLQVAKGDLAAAGYWLETCELVAENKVDFLHDFAHLTFARILLAQGKVGEAEQLLARLLESAESVGRMGRVIETLVIQSLACQAKGDLPHALAALARALDHAESEGYVRTFLDEGAPMINLLRHAGSRGIAPQYVARLLSEFDRTEGAAITAKQPLIDPLSERELEVLRLVAAGKSNDEVAEELVLATGTVKKHLSNIFGKLNAQNRTECVARARELRLL
ncbi:MAG: helix-turn-helix transcriptional regulator [Chloroflexi bacterium]|nr:helix-turn-helix transcriptional regulator [Chloroflexota bacterium]